jgi:hypothetical protein
MQDEKGSKDDREIPEQLKGDGLAHNLNPSTQMLLNWNQRECIRHRYPSACEFRAPRKSAHRVYDTQQDCSGRRKRKQSLQF